MCGKKGEIPLPGFREKSGESCIPVEEQSQTVEDQADELAFGQVEEEFGDIPLPNEGSIVSEFSWQYFGLTGFDQRFMHHYAKTTRKFAPDWVALSVELLILLFLFLRVSLCALSVLTFSMVVIKFLLQQDVCGMGLSSVLRVHGDGEDLPGTVSSGRMLPRTGIGGVKVPSTEMQMFSLDFFEEGMDTSLYPSLSTTTRGGGGDVMRSPLSTALLT